MATLVDNKSVEHVGSFNLQEPRTQSVFFECLKISSYVSITATFEPADLKAMFGGFLNEETSESDFEQSSGRALTESLSFENIS